jgi:cyclin H
VYLACKVEEFNVSISQFVQNINSNEDRDDLANMILNYELLIMVKLDFHLTIHNFYNPFEGFLLDVKVNN